MRKFIISNNQAKELARAFYDGIATDIKTAREKSQQQNNNTEDTLESVRKEEEQ
jgi:hypothetical protein